MQILRTKFKKEIISEFLAPIKKGAVKDIKLKISRKDKDIFKAIKSGKKKIETRAATGKYRKIKEGDILEFICEEKKSAKK